MSILRTSSLCPNGASHAILKSRRKGLPEQVLHSVFFVSPLHCGACDERYFRARFVTPPHASKHHPHAA